MGRGDLLILAPRREHHEQREPLRADLPPTRVKGSLLKLDRGGMVSDGGPPRCLGCDLRLQFGTDRDGQATEPRLQRIRRVRKDAAGARGFATGAPEGGNTSGCSPPLLPAAT